MDNSIKQIRRNVFYSNYKDNLSSINNNEPIYLITQFFLHKNKKRCEEIKDCLKKNINLGIFTNIILLNERIYTNNEMDLTETEGEKIIQVNIKSRLKYIDIFMNVKKLKLGGYIVFCNSDIFFDDSIKNVSQTSLSFTKSIYCLLRYEYTHVNLNKCKIFTFNGKPRKDSQDTWIYHTNKMEITNDLLHNTNFMLGMPGCDNKITYVFTQLGYKCFNEPSVIKTYHHHSSEIRNYSRKDLIPSPYLLVEPIIRKFTKN